MIKADIKKFLEQEHQYALIRMRTFGRPWVKTWMDSNRANREELALSLKAAAGNVLICNSQSPAGLKAAIELLDVLLQAMHTIGYSNTMYDEPLWEPAEAADQAREFMGKIAYVVEQFPRADCCFRRVSWSLPLAVVRVTQWATTQWPQLPAAILAFHDAEMAKCWAHPLVNKDKIAGQWKIRIIHPEEKTCIVESIPCGNPIPPLNWKDVDYKRFMPDKMLPILYRRSVLQSDS